MITNQDLEKKQIIFIFSMNGEKMRIQNENFLVEDADGKVKLKITCYRLFIVNIIGSCSITSVLVNKAKKYGFFINLYSTGFHLISVIGANKEGNFLLKRKQYEIKGLEMPKVIVKNKIISEIMILKKIRNKTYDLNTCISKLNEYFLKVDNVNDLNELLSYEGLSAKIYFKQMFDNIGWNGRKPRLKNDIVNCLLDIGYTILFNYIDALLNSFGFDTYCGVYHKLFYMRKSLTCDLVEPFRVLIDYEIRKAYNLNIVNENDFMNVNHQYCVCQKAKSKYISFLIKPIIDNSSIIYKYIQAVYRSFMKNESNKIKMPLVLEGEILYDINKL